MDDWKNDKFPRDCSSGAGNYLAYSIEARHNSHHPKTICGQLFDREWRRVNTATAPEGFGVPVPNRLHAHQQDLRLLSWSQANALRWWLHCAADEYGLGSLCLETRIVEHDIEFKWSEKVVAAYAPMGGDDFGGIKVPDTPHWPKKEPAEAG